MKQVEIKCKLLWPLKWSEWYFVITRIMQIFAVTIGYNLQDTDQECKSKGLGQGQ